MKVLKSKRNGNTMSLEVEATHDELASKFDSAFKKVSKKASLPGFRKGKIPRKVFEKNFGKTAIIQEAIYDVVNDTYKSAIDELNLKVVDYPKNVDIDEYKENKPVIFRCDVDVEPELKLKKYKGLKVTVDTKQVTDADVQSEMDTLMGMHATYEVVDAESQDSDIVRFNATVTVDGEPYEPWSRDNQATRIGVANFGADVDTKLTGLKSGDKTTFTVDYPADYKIERLQGKTASFDIEVKEIRQRKLPELTDELVAKIDKNSQSVDEWKASLTKELTKRYENENNHKTETAVLDALREENPVEIPDKMVENETTMSLMEYEYMLRQQGMDLNQYMAMTNTTEAMLRDNFKERSINKVHIRKIMEAIIEKEKFEVSDDDLQDEINEWNDNAIKTLDDLRASKRHHVPSIKSQLLNKKVMKFLVDSAKIK